VAIPYIRQHGDPYVFPTGVAEQRNLEVGLTPGREGLRILEPVVR
jgi:hypothetical protein